MRELSHDHAATGVEAPLVLAIHNGVALPHDITDCAKKVEEAQQPDATNITDASGGGCVSSLGPLSLYPEWGQIKGKGKPKPKKRPKPRPRPRPTAPKALQAENEKKPEVVEAKGAPVAAIVIGSVLFLLLCLILIICCCCQEEEKEKAVWSPWEEETPDPTEIHVGDRVEWEEDKTTYRALVIKDPVRERVEKERAEWGGAGGGDWEGGEWDEDAGAYDAKAADADGGEADPEAGGEEDEVFYTRVGFIAKIFTRPTVLSSVL